MIYEYQCDRGHVFSARVKLCGEGAPTVCPHKSDIAPDAPCGEPVKRILSAPASVFPKADSWRR